MSLRRVDCYNYAIPGSVGFRHDDRRLSLERIRSCHGLDLVLPPLESFPPPVEEVNFWTPKPRGGHFRVLTRGQPLLFKLKSRHNVIAGGGFFEHYTELPSGLAWQAFGEKTVLIEPPLHVNPAGAGRWQPDRAFHVVDRVIRRVFRVAFRGDSALAGRSKNGDGITARVGVFGGRGATISLTATPAVRLRQLAEFLDPTVLGIPGSPVRLLGHRMRRVGDPAQATGHSVRLTLYVLNDTDTSVRGWRGDLQITDPFGDDLVLVELTVGDSPLGPGDRSVVLSGTNRSRSALLREPFGSRFWCVSPHSTSWLI